MVIPDFDTEAIDRIVEMAWEDRTPFEAIALQFGLDENQVIALMRQQMLESSFKMWRKRVTNVATKKLGQASTQTNYLLGALNPLIKLALIFQALRPSVDAKPNTSNSVTSPKGGFVLKIKRVRDLGRHDDPPNACNDFSSLSTNCRACDHPLLQDGSGNNLVFGQWHSAYSQAP